MESVKDETDDWDALRLAAKLAELLRQARERIERKIDAKTV